MVDYRPIVDNIDPLVALVHCCLSWSLVNPGAGLPEEPKGHPGQDCWLLQPPCQGCHHPTAACCIAGPDEY